MVLLQDLSKLDMVFLFDFMAAIKSNNLNNLTVYTIL